MGFALLIFGNFVFSIVPSVIRGLFGTFVYLSQLRNCSLDNFFEAVLCMNKVNVVQFSPRPLTDISEFSESLRRIDYLPGNALTLPTQVALASADIASSQQLDRLFPLDSIADYPLSRLRPTGLDPEIFSPSFFRDSLSSWQQKLPTLALQRPRDARKLGRLARLITEQDSLFRLAQMYASALVQG
jgi:hypothetical protein